MTTCGARYPAVGGDVGDDGGGTWMIYYDMHEMHMLLDTHAPGNTHACVYAESNAQHSPQPGMTQQ
jgi:hypothetical protein